MGERTSKNQVLKMSDRPSTPLNTLKWILVFVLIIGGIFANTYYDNVAWAVRTALGILILIATVAVAFQTVQGHAAFQFIKAAKGELRKVVWPTRQETVQTTMIVVAMVVFSALVLWGLDTFFFWLVGWLAGQRG
jgi:preprotein translocase subunit SecE